MTGTRVPIATEVLLSGDGAVVCGAELQYHPLPLMLPFKYGSVLRDFAPKQLYFPHGCPLHFGEGATFSTDLPLRSWARGLLGKVLLAGLWWSLLHPCIGVAASSNQVPLPWEGKQSCAGLSLSPGNGDTCLQTCHQLLAPETL